MSDYRIAIIVDPTLPLGFLANTVATIAVGIGAAQPIFGNTVLTDVAGRSIYNSADRPVPILQASPDLIRSVLLKTFPTPSEARVIPFPEFARSLHAFADYQAQLPTRDLAVEPITGLGIAGPEKWVKSLTGNLKLLR
jgi:hypothetical protein